MTHAEEQKPEHLPGPRDPESHAPYALESTRQRGLLGWFNRRRKRDEKINQLQSGYQELVGLIQSIRDHMDQQSENQKRLAVVLGQMPDAVNSLKTLGESAERQREVMGLVKEQLVVNAQRDEQVVNSIDRFNDTLQVMDKTNRRSADTIAQLTERARESELQLRSMLERSEKRLIYLISLLIGLILVVVGLTVGYTLIPKTTESVLVDTNGSESVEVIEAEELAQPMPERSIAVLEAVEPVASHDEAVHPQEEEVVMPDELPEVDVPQDGAIEPAVVEMIQVEEPDEAVAEESEPENATDDEIAPATDSDASPDLVPTSVEVTPDATPEPEPKSFWSRLKKTTDTP